MPTIAESVFLFTDVEGSTRLWERNAHAMRAALAKHDEILAEDANSHKGRVFKTIGDAFCIVFDDADDALATALAAQRGLLAGEPLFRVRMAIHTGEAEERGGDFFGPSLSRVNRLLEAGHGGQILLSSAARASLDGAVSEGVEVRDLGPRQLKDLPGSERVFQISAPGLPDSFPPLRTLDVRAGSLPTPPTPLIGRETEVAEASARIREGTRLLTLTGSGGTGKTRVALRVAESLTDEFEDGVFFVPLAPLGDPDLVVSRISGVLGVAEAGNTPLAEIVKEYLRDKETLLVLDNFEHVLDGAILVSELLSACPKLNALATSRSALHLYGESEYPVPPLALPSVDGGYSTEELSRCESMRLFVERARDVKFGFAITDENAPDIAEICHRLDGLPLAIELAAARARMLPPKEILARLDDRMKLLADGARDLPDRHRSLRKAIAWSHDLLDEDEKLLFRRLGVFAGGFTLETAGSVWGVAGDSDDVYRLVESLLEKSLVQTHETTDELDEADSFDGPRFSMLRTIREYAIERLEASGESEEAKRRHAECFRELAERGEIGLKTPRQSEWLQTLDLEHDNLRAALAWSLESGETETSLRISGSLGYFWNMRGHITEGRRWLDESLAGGGAPKPRAKALNEAGSLAMEWGDLDRAAPLLEEGLSLSRDSGYTEGVAYALSDLSWMACHGGEHPRAEALAEEAFALYRELGQRWGMTNSLASLTYAKNCLGDQESAMELLEEALALSREAGEKQSVATALNNLGYFSLFHGDRRLAAEHLEESVAILREVGDRLGCVVTTCNLAWTRLVSGETVRAAELFEEALALFREVGGKVSAAECLEGLAGVAGVFGEHVRAATLWGAAESLREETAPLSTDEKNLREPFIEAVRSRLGEAAWDEVASEGKKMALDEAVDLALEGSGDARTA